ncbi:hypothetical protein P1X15_04580 [Runella sp. MFBS21]|uniref:hypothetical protein n=1 Tax=Runella sp. MFBS21 TaxID=3034018 RepID=UPI0023F632B3|nr:hypothetical protein [Runella sp. MFBS21]MDF7816856.1 hypothetical protein [Runella sp. MFBS21]
MTFKDFNVLLIRLFLGYLFTSSGLCKLTEGQFGQLIGPPLLIQQLTPHGLRTFGFFVAISQVLAGALVLSQRYSLLGLIMLIPMNLGILMVTISQQWQGTPYVDAVFTLLNILALLYEWNSLKFFIFPEQKPLVFPPKTHQFFPNALLPLLIILLFGICILLSRFAIMATSMVAIVGYGLVYYHVFKSQTFNAFYKSILVMSFLAIVGLTLITLLHQSLPFNPMLIVAIPIFGTIACYLITCGWQVYTARNSFKG